MMSKRLILKTFDIQLSQTRSKLNTIHPSDLADIIEDMSQNYQTPIFSSLDEEHAADVSGRVKGKKNRYISLKACHWKRLRMCWRRCLPMRLLT